MEYRIEHDSMGEVQVPADRYWGATDPEKLPELPYWNRKRSPWK